MKLTYIPKSIISNLEDCDSSCFSVMFKLSGAKYYKLHLLRSNLRFMSNKIGPLSDSYFLNSQIHGEINEVNSQ